jgi:hypothetical protein
MESTVRAPQAGDMVLVLAKMISGNFTVISGPVVENSAGYVYFDVNGLELIP